MRHCAIERSENCKWTEDDRVPDPSRRPVPGPTRTLPDYGMDEGPNTDPVDFAERSGLQRVLGVGRG